MPGFSVLGGELAENATHSRNEYQLMSHLIRGYQLSQAIAAMAKLNIADLLADGFRSASELAQATGTHPESLNRLLDALVSFDVLIRNEAGMFGLTPLGSTIRTDVSNSLRAMAIVWCRPEMYSSWLSIDDSIRTGTPSFNNIFGVDFYGHLGQNKEYNDVFNQAMGSMDRHTEVINMNAFSDSKCVLDVGGGRGDLIRCLLEQNPLLNGILLELAHVTEDARKLLDTTQVDTRKRLSIVTGDMFISVPAGADTVILSHILMNFDDTKTKLLMSNCRAAMTAGAKLLIIDVVLSENASQPDGRLNDLNMLVLLGGRHRTEQQYVKLIEESGFILQSNIKMKCIDSLLTCIAV